MGASHIGQVDNFGLLNCVISTFLAGDMSLKPLKSISEENLTVGSRIYPLYRQKRLKSKIWNFGIVILLAKKVFIFDHSGQDRDTKK